MARRKGRILAFQALYAWEVGATDPENIFEFAWASPALLERLGEDGLAFSRLIVRGVLDNIEKIDAMISKYLVNWELGRISKVDLAILRMSVYALLYQQDIHPSITIDEAIDIAHEFASDDAFRFINGILGAIQSHELQSESAKKDACI
ncbi:MAG: transcription antitermination factor NusB [Spirochaetales bacterium]